jgi:DNA-binding transcriptional ArsR family regulator
MAGRRAAASRAAQPPAPRPPRRPASASSSTTGLDRLIHDRTRLAIVSALAVNDVLSFSELKAITETSDGNLSVHSRKLEEARYLTCTKSFDGRVPKTEFRLADAGHRALQRYLDHMEAIIRSARGRRP